jgi:hypothetical protein
MWLRVVGKAAFAAKQVYSLVFYSVLTWHVIRHQFKKGSPWEKELNTFDNSRKDFRREGHRPSPH